MLTLSLLKKSFNSTLVRLNLTASDNERFAKELFQFHTGTIKPILLEKGMSIRYLFQFHTGTIKPLKWIQRLISCITFQFHTGTIKPSPTNTG